MSTLNDFIGKIDPRHNFGATFSFRYHEIIETQEKFAQFFGRVVDRYARPAGFFSHIDGIVTSLTEYASRLVDGSAKIRMFIGPKGVAVLYGDEQSNRKIPDEGDILPGDLKMVSTIADDFFYDFKKDVYCFIKFGELGLISKEPDVSDVIPDGLPVLP